ncbi:hypothetical protein BCF59_0525 [Mycoplasmopsis mustelae]|uniref:Uncharacterized protein n=1 Tax=Mycoplasmopsis mustelae TaxID=171289 RepID=A0A4R7UED6_9BACT|nr:hypothetical protein BCF59_0525 [Mycoplasmopsis mustelae]
MLFGILLVQLFIHYVYSYNLKIKYSKISIIFQKPLIPLIQNSLQNRYKSSFSISLKHNYFKDFFNVYKHKIYLNDDFLNSNIYSLVNLIFINESSKWITIKDQNYQLVNKILAISFLTLSWILLLISLWVSALVFMCLFLIIILVDFLWNYRKFQNIYLNSKNYLISHYHNQNLTLILSYLKYKKFFILQKYLTFYTQIITECIKTFKKWGQNE